MLVSRVSLPRPPQPAPPYRFPLLASLAPLVLAVALWAITGSAFALLFAVLGPVTAVASVADARLGSRRALRRERVRFDSELMAARAAIAAEHESEAAALAEASPSAAELIGRAGADPFRWTADAASPVPVRVGSGAVGSALQLDGEATDPALAALREVASLLRDAPVAVDARLGIGVCGPPAAVRTVARAIVVETAWALSPARYWCSATNALGLPHPQGRRTRDGFVAEFGPLGDDTAVVVIALASAPVALPGECRVVIAVDERGWRITQHPDREQRRPIWPVLVSRAAAREWGARAIGTALRDGVVANSAPPSTAPPLAALLRAPGTGSLAVELGVDSVGPVTVDLVADGPHAVIGGTTGSGKSELLVSWVVAMAATASPAQVTFLLVDFKGGSAFGPLADLPHTVGIITDLDEVRAARALASLRAELRFRERALAAAGARDVDGVDGLPRLVIVVDEFAAMLADHPELHALFADVAARGRSLGVHLVLCTQRPAGVVRDAVLANADLRISLRVNNRADSSAVVGTDAAAALPTQARGSGILAPSGAEPRRVQFALASSSDVDTVTTRWVGQPPPRRPWCEPLPAVVTHAELEPGAFGLLDLPHEQRRAMASWTAREHGHVLVLGSSGSGTSTALRALAPDRWLPADLPAAWDVLMAFDDGVLAIDDVDSLLARCPQEYQTALVERLTDLLRDGPGRGIHLLLAAKRLTPDLQSLAALVPSRLLLRHASRQDWLLAGGETASWPGELAPGGGVWRGDRVQVALATGTPPVVEPRVETLGPGPIAVVSTRPRSWPGRRVLSIGEATDLQPADVVVGDVEEWQSRWGALALLRPVARILFEGCSVADFRALTRSRELPPPLAGLNEVAWEWLRDGSAVRVRL